jgi:hypothetical protein
MALNVGLDYFSTGKNRKKVGEINNTLSHLPHVGAVEAQKPRNTQATMEAQVFISRCWATSSSTMNSLQTALRPFLRNDSVNTLQKKKEVEFSVRSARRLYNATLVIFEGALQRTRQ